MVLVLADKAEDASMFPFDSWMLMSERRAGADLQKKGCDDVLAFFPETEEKKRRLRTNRDDLERSERRRGRLSARSFRQTEAIRTNLGTQLDERDPPVWNLLSLLRRKSGPCSGRG